MRFLPALLWRGANAATITAVYLCVVGIEHAIRYFVEAREREVQVARLSEQLAGARFAALQAQVNPHFLFNTLNTITVFVRDDDRQAAVRIIEQLSDVLRTTLSSHRADEVPLSEELELVRQDVAIEAAPPRHHCAQLTFSINPKTLGNSNACQLQVSSA